MRLAYLLPFLLSGCLLPDVFYIGELSDHDQAIFKVAARMEHVDVVTAPVPGAWVVLYGEPLHQNGQLAPHSVLIDRDVSHWESSCPRDQAFLVTSRHEIRHTQGEWHSDDSDSIMHYPTPCWPAD